MNVRDLCLTLAPGRVSHFPARLRVVLRGPRRVPADEPVDAIATHSQRREFTAPTKINQLPRTTLHLSRLWCYLRTTTSCILEDPTFRDTDVIDRDNALHTRRQLLDDRKLRPNA